MSKFDEFSEKLLVWFESNRRHFPWRNTRDPYKILLAEVFLRKTDAPKVVDVYERFIEKYPTSKELANVPQDELERTLKPLGLFRRRGKELKLLAETLVLEHSGDIPHSRQELLKLPGVGNYISNAVLCFAFGKHVPLLDTNVIRVVTRVFSLKPARKRARDDPEMWQTVKKMIPLGKARDFNLAILDFAATICLSRNPKCSVCPIRSICDYGRTVLKVQ